MQKFKPAEAVLTLKLTRVPQCVAVCSAIIMPLPFSRLVLHLVLLLLPDDLDVVYFSFWQHPYVASAA